MGGSLMKRILLTWELGGNYGHIAVLLPVAHHLRQCGHEILFVIKDSTEAGPLLDTSGFCRTLTPRRSAGGKRKPLPASFIDIIDRAGFGSPDILAELVAAWRDIYASFQPDVIIAQYAPLAVFTARLAGKPCLQLNTGFESPPDTAPFPCFRPNLKRTKEQLLAREAALLDNVNLFCAGNDCTPFSNMQDVIKADLDLLVTLPELDHYQGRSGGRFIGPIFIAEEGVSVSWSGRTAHRIFLYLRSFPGLESILETLKRSDAEVIACIPGASATLLSAFAGGSIRICTTMVRLAVILANADLVITHTGHGTTANAFLAGVPMLMIPTTIEQWLLTRKMERLGVGIGVRRERIAEQFPPSFAKLLGDTSFRQKAKTMAGRYVGYDQRRVIERIANTVERLPAWQQRRQR